MPPYELTRCDCVGEVRLWSSADLDMLLGKRDENRAMYDRHKVYFRVTDTDDAERGEAEFCEDCGAHGCFTGPDGYFCDLCNQRFEEEEAAAS